MADSNHLKLRTTILVASLIVLPLAAVCGLKWPRFPTADQATSPLASPLREAPKPLLGSAPAWDRNGSSTTQLPKATPPSTVVPAGGTNHVNQPDYQVTQVANNDVRFPTDAGSVADAVLDPNSTGTQPVSASVEPPATTDPFLQIQQRLKSLGAIHYSLETWGAQGEAYRFQCRMAAGHNPGYSRHFEATDMDPLRVMQTVLNDVEAWKSGRLP